MRPIGLDGFEKTFLSSRDPWATFTNRDEAHKRGAILRALGPGKRGRVLELAAGNGSNSVALAARALRLVATEGTAEGARLVAEALPASRRHRGLRLILPARPPRAAYDAIVVAELLYYLSPRDMRVVARDMAAALRPGGRLVLAHHRIDFHDFAQHADGIHARFLRATRRRWRAGSTVRNRRWLVTGYDACA